MVLFYISSAVALFATVFALTRSNAAHALIYLIVSLLAVAVIFFLLGAPFAAALEIVIYAGAIMVLFVFVIMMLNLGEEGEERERQRMHPAVWIGPALLSAILLVEMIIVLSKMSDQQTGALITAKQVGISLFGPYVLAVEIASMLLLAGLVGAYHVGRRFRLSEPDDQSAVVSGDDKQGGD
ncbi:MAG: NADH-quinone oxidoreductase subunit J [Arenicella sp.]|nr:NADH-quinone oxidoreductase subunit J [Arenicella sp.]